MLLQSPPLNSIYFWSPTYFSCCWRNVEKLLCVKWKKNWKSDLLIDFMSAFSLYNVFVYPYRMHLVFVLWEFKDRKNWWDIENSNIRNDSLMIFINIILNMRAFHIQILYIYELHILNNVLLFQVNWWWQNYPYDSHFNFILSHVRTMNV